MEGLARPPNSRRLFTRPGVPRRAPKRDYFQSEPGIRQTRFDVPGIRRTAVLHLCRGRDRLSEGTPYHRSKVRNVYFIVAEIKRDARISRVRESPKTRLLFYSAGLFFASFVLSSPLLFRFRASSVRLRYERNQLKWNSSAAHVNLILRFAFEEICSLLSLVRTRRAVVGIRGSLSWYFNAMTYIWRWECANLANTQKKKNKVCLSYLRVVSNVWSKFRMQLIR